MENKKFVVENKGVVYFKYPDGSMVRCVLTGNKEIAKENGIEFPGDYLYDLEVKRKLPEQFYSMDCEIYSMEDDPDKLNELDKLLNDKIKLSWR